MATNKKILNVLYQSDDNYAMVSGISIVSLLENNQHLDQINVYYCDYKISKQNCRKLEKVVSGYANGTLHFIDTQKYHDRFQELGVRAWHGVYVTWLKLFAFGDVPINTDRVLFINGHTIINGPLDELIELDFEDNIMAMGYDSLVNEHKNTIGLDLTDGYFNCGIMLINHKKWKRENISKMIDQHLSEKNDYVIADQDLCNVLFRGKIKLLKPTYNFSSAYYAYDLKRLLRVNHLKPPFFYSYDELMETYYTPKIIHSLFGLVGKPWEEGNEHPNRFLWNKYIQMTPWKDSPKPVAKQNFNGFLYKVLPSFIFMRLYGIQMYRLYAGKK